MTRVNEELTRQLQSKQKELEEKNVTITKCLNVVKELLIEKSKIERKEARGKCMQNRLRLGQFVTQRVGATFQENWTDGYAFQDLSKRQESINNEREEIERKKKLLAKRKPAEAGGNANRKRASSNSNSGNSSSANCSNVMTSATSSNTASVASPTSCTGPVTGPGNSVISSSSSNLHNGVGGNAGGGAGSSGSGPQGNSGDETLFTKPPPRDHMTVQEYYEAEEILRLRLNSLKKEDVELQLEMEKLERSRNLHIRELKRIANEDQSRYNNHPMLNDRYLLLVLLGKGGFSEVHKVREIEIYKYFGIY